MAAMILIVCLAVIAILGGWWLKQERKNQKNDLIRQGKLAAGKFDEVVLPKKKPKKRKRKKREGSWWDPKYVPPEIPDKHQLNDWLARAEKIVDELMPRVAAYRLEKAQHDPVEIAANVAEAQLVRSYKSDAVTAVEAQEWLDSIEQKLRAYLEAKAEHAMAARKLKRLYAPVAEPGVQLRYLLSQANAWELYRAPEPFHEKLELLTLLYDGLKYEFDLDNAQIGMLRDKSKRRFDHAAGQDGSANSKTDSESSDNGSPYKPDGNIGARESDNADSADFVDNPEKFAWQPDKPARRRSWDWRAEPEPEPVEDAEITPRTRQMLVDALTHIAALSAAADACSNSQKKYREAGNLIALTRPAKPVDADVDAVLGSAFQWAKTYQVAKTTLWNDGLALRRAMESVENTLPALKVAVGKLKDAHIPQGDNISRDVIIRALEQIEAYVKHMPEWNKTALGMTQPYAIGKEEPQSDKDAAANLRNLMRKACFALAQAEVAKANHEAAKAEHVSQAESVPPVLTQSSASAFINAHTRMVEISTRNTEKRNAHDTKVKQLRDQQSEREQQATQAVRAINTAINGMGNKREGWSANLELTHAAALLFHAVINK